MKNKYEVLMNNGEGKNLHAIPHLVPALTLLSVTGRRGNKEIIIRNRVKVLT